MVVLRFGRSFKVELGLKCLPRTVQAGANRPDRNAHGLGNAFVSQISPCVEQQRFPVDRSHIPEGLSNSPGGYLGVDLSSDPVGVIGYGLT